MFRVLMIFMFMGYVYSVAMATENSVPETVPLCQEAVNSSALSSNRPRSSSTAVDIKTIRAVMTWRNDKIPLEQQRQLLSAMLREKHFGSAIVASNVDTILGYSNRDLMRLYTGRNISVESINSELMDLSGLDLMPFLSGETIDSILPYLDDKRLFHLFYALEAFYDKGALTFSQRLQVITLTGSILSLKTFPSTPTARWTFIERSAGILEKILLEKVWRSERQQILASEALLQLSQSVRTSPIKQRNIFANNIKQMIRDFHKEFERHISRETREKIVANLMAAIKE